MDLCIFKDKAFFIDGKLDIKAFQKTSKKYTYLPHRSRHAEHLRKNYVLGKLTMNFTSGSETDGLKWTVQDKVVRAFDYWGLRYFSLQMFKYEDWLIA